MRIISASISPLPRPMPEGMLDPMPVVTATFEDGTSKKLFSYFPDEIAFAESEFAGLSEDEALKLYHDRDVAFLKAQV